MIQRVYHLLILIALLFSGIAFASDVPPKAADASLSKILSGMEIRYSGPGFSADFNQVATLKALNIKDVAAGHAVFKQPGKMRWVYQSPEPQTIITDGKTVWIYRPDDNQVITGSATDYFGDGNGGSFLTDIKNLKTVFDIVLERTDDMGHHLKLYPKKESGVIKEVRLVVNKSSYEIITIQTVNPYNDVTEINLLNLDFNPDLNDTQFGFTIPAGAQQLKMENK